MALVLGWAHQCLDSFPGLPLPMITRHVYYLFTQVNGIDVSALSTQEVLALLSSEKHMNLILYREPSVTLL